MHVTLPEPVDRVTVDVGWTRQERILPHVLHLVTASARAVTLIKPHYEAPPSRLVDGCLADEDVSDIVASVQARIAALGWEVLETFPSPLRGHGGNREVFALLQRSQG